MTEKSPSSLDEKMLFYDRFADQFDSVMNMYDTHRRLEILFDDFLPHDLQGKTLLDAGSGTGWFSQRAVKQGADVTSLDVGENILGQVAKKCETQRIVGNICQMDFHAESFDIVLSSEVLEHTNNPRQALHELQRVLKKEGTLVLTVPNRIWKFAVILANLLKIRPYEGYENWLGWFQLKRWLAEENLEIVEIRGFHLFPFILSFTHPFLRSMDRYGKTLGPLMLNIAVHCKKK
jgi:2-polyprenyl-3-methyl-5-hydroxy-6-metoxy-1,4-benzoquinol methylase